MADWCCIYAGWNGIADTAVSSAALQPEQT